MAFIRRSGAEYCQKIVTFMLFFSSLGTMAQESRGVRLEVSSIEFEEKESRPAARANDVNEEAQASNNQTVGVGKTVRVKFRIPDELRQLDAPYRVPSGEGRVGLFLKRERGTHASVQRGTLEKCETGFCSAVFRDNALFRFYQDQMKNSGNWFIQSLQNPAIEERWLELGKVEEDPGWDYKWHIEPRYTRAGLFLVESSSTPFNSAKSSTRLSHGHQYDLILKADNLELHVEAWNISLSTTGFFEDSFSTSYKGSRLGLRYGVPWGKSMLIGGELFRIDETFETSNDDEAILNTKYQSFQLGAYLRYIIPKDFVRFAWKNFALELGEGMLSISTNVLGSSEDTGEWKRGSSSSWKKHKIYFEHFISTRSSSAWYDGWKFGVNAAFSLTKEDFSGAASGPSTGLPEGTSANGKYTSWGFSFGRRFVW